jgi:hypothetical protein
VRQVPRPIVSQAVRGFPGSLGVVGDDHDARLRLGAAKHGRLGAKPCRPCPVEQIIPSRHRLGRRYRAPVRGMAGRRLDAPCRR